MGRSPNRCKADFVINAPFLSTYENAINALPSCWAFPPAFWSVTLIMALTHLESVSFNASILSLSQYTI